MARSQDGTVIPFFKRQEDAVQATLTVTENATRRRRRFEDYWLVPGRSFFPPSACEDATPLAPSSLGSSAAFPEAVVLPPLPMLHVAVPEDVTAGAICDKNLRNARRQHSQEAVGDRDVEVAAISLQEAEPLQPLSSLPTGPWYQSFGRCRRQCQGRHEVPFMTWAPFVLFALLVLALIVWLVVYLVPNGHTPPVPRHGVFTSVRH